MTELRDGLARRDLSKTDKYLLIVASHDGPITTREIKAIAKNNGWRDGSTSEPSPFLNKSKYAVSLPNGWALTTEGRVSLEERKIVLHSGILTPVVAALEKYLLDVHDSDKSRFIEEAVQCVRNKAFRAAIVLSWVGAVYLLYNYVLSHKLKEFNAEVRRRWQKHSDAKGIDDLASLKEGDFLSVLEHIKVITNAQSKELTGCLNRRNTAGHPNSHSFEEVTVGSHIQTLISVVYSKF
ncbi:hypothetical protein [Methylocystis sp. SC2]|uniref:hypothetical protein n=1 Tax=Methylocystis sp. (strain SC2) TaxID=187303 RepID=UPI00027AE96E|nr:hypothetical protein [Methylocystis sp. SC2]CCJ07967.1 Uncharacterized protein BN69_2516 [Methylocystis sp. SC2]